MSQGPFWELYICFNLHNNPTMHYYHHFKNEETETWELYITCLTKWQNWDSNMGLLLQDVCALHHYASPPVTDTSCTPFAVTCLVTAASDQPHTGPSWPFTSGSDLTLGTVWVTQKSSESSDLWGALTLTSGGRGQMAQCQHRLLSPRGSSI